MSNAQQSNLPAAEPLLNSHRRHESDSETYPPLSVANKTAITKQKARTPLSLKRPLIFSFVAAVVLQLGALEGLKLKSSQNHGFVPVRPALHYLWTFTPTAVLTIFGACWNRVDSRTRRNAPMVQLATTKLQASCNVLLDYTSPLDIQSLLTSLSAGNLAVFCSVLASLMVRLAIVISTGLFVLQYPPVLHDTSMTALDDFDLTKELPTGVDGPNRIVPAALGPTLFNTSYPEGTNSLVAIQSVVGPIMSNSNYTYQAHINMASADLNCEPAQWSYSNLSHPFADASLGDGSAQFNLESISWNITNLTLITTGPSFIGWANMTAHPNTIPSDDPPKAGWLQNSALMNISCIDGITGDRGNCFVVTFGISSIYHASTTNGSANTPLLTAGSRDPAVTAHWAGQKRQVAFGSNGQPLSLTQVQVTNMTALICKPTLSFSKAIVSFPQNTASTLKGFEVVRVLENLPASSVPFSPFEIGLRVRAISQQRSMIGWGGRAIDFIGLCDMLSPYEDITHLFDPVVLMNTTREVYQRLSAQYLKAYLTGHANGPVAAQLNLVGPRLVVDNATLRFMDAILGVFALCALGMCLGSTSPNMPRQFTSIGSLALLLRSSPGFERLCFGTATSRSSDMKIWLYGYRFYSRYVQHSSGDNFQIVSELCKAPGEGEERPDLKQSVKWWRPVAFSMGLRLLTILGPLLLVAGLELSRNRSESHMGLGTAPERGYTKCAWQFGPALVMTIVTMLFGSLDFSTRLFWPYHSLSAKRGARFDDLLDSPLDHVAIQSAWRSLRGKQWALFATSTAICISPLLTIVVSGLFQAQSTSVARSEPIRLKGTLISQSDLRIFTGYDSSATISAMILYNNISWPRYTYQNLVLPEFEVGQNDSHIENSRYQASVPAVKMVSNCAVMSSNDVVWQSQVVASGHAEQRPTLVLDLNLTTVSKCTTSFSKSQDDDVSSFQFIEVFDSFVSSMNITTDRMSVRLEVDQSWPEEGIVPYIASPSSVGLTCDGTTDGVVPIQYVFLQFEQGIANDVAIAQCTPQADLTMANVTFEAPSYAIHDVKLDPEVQRTFTKNELMFSEPGYSCSDNRDNVGNETCTQQALMNSIYGVSGDRILGSENADALANGVSQILNIVFAQRFSSLFRAGLNNTANQTLLLGPEALGTANVLDQTQLRVVQSRISTIILQCLLSSLALCALVAWVGTKSQEILPKNPTTIAAMASLLAGAKMLHDQYIPAGAELLSDKELLKQGVLEGCRFRIGWWGEGANRRYGIDVVEDEQGTR